jgi:hypothetical protein
MPAFEESGEEAELVLFAKGGHGLMIFDGE